MAFSEIIGNDLIKDHLCRMVQKNMVGNSLLFSGPEAVGKGLFAHALAKLLLCDDASKEPALRKMNSGNHPDIHIYRPEGKIGMHSIASMRQLSEEVYLPPYEAERKIFIIHDAERMLPYGANALLKTFEEPSLDSVIILLSSSSELLLPTIKSRCRSIYFQSLTDSEIAMILQKKHSLSEAEALKIASICGGSLLRALDLHEKKELKLRPIILEVLIAGRFASYGSLIAKAKEIAEIIEQTTSLMENQIKEELVKCHGDNKLNAQQRESIEKESEGAAAMALTHQASQLFDLILQWYRDIRLLQANGNKKYLFYQDYIEPLVLASKQNQSLSLEMILSTVKSAKTSLARSTSLAICLENLFLRLDFF